MSGTQYDVLYATLGIKKMSCITLIGRRAAAAAAAAAADIIK